jgi:hypothetical protein
MGVLLGLTRTQAPSICGSKVYDLKPFDRVQKPQFLEQLAY